MLAFRSLVLGLLGACVFLLAQLDTRMSNHAPPPVAAHTETMPVTIIDAVCYSCGSGSGPSDEYLASLVRVSPEEVVVAVDDLHTRTSVLDAIHDRGEGHSHGEFIDLEIEGSQGIRRVLLLLH